MAKPSDRLDYQSFYGQRRESTYGRDYTLQQAEQHSFYPVLRKFVTQYQLEDKSCLEIGSSGGMFQDVVKDYYGTDISSELAQHYHKPYRVAEGATYPFADAMFDAIWSHAVFEHIPDLQTALNEVVRLLRPGGYLLFAPAWQCRPWAAEGYPVRPYSDFGLGGKLVKASIPLRDSVLWRSLFIFPKRAWRHLQFLVGRRFRQFPYRRLRANYERFWMSDSDACNSIDPHDAILWFESHGLRCLSHPLHWRAFWVRTGGLVFQKRAP